MYQYVVSLFVRFPIKGGPGVLVKVSVQELVLLRNRFFDVANLTILTPLSLFSEVECHSQSWV